MELAKRFDLTVCASVLTVGVLLASVLTDGTKIASARTAPTDTIEVERDVNALIPPPSHYVDEARTSECAE